MLLPVAGLKACYQKGLSHSLVLSLKWHNPHQQIPRQQILRQQILRQQKPQITETQTTETQTTEKSAEASLGESKVLITDFENEAEANRWRSVNDNVMGGNSQGGVSLSAEGTAIFTGTISLENNGGFSSVRRTADAEDFDGASAIALRIKGDGQRYQLRLKMSTFDRAPSYRAEFDTTAGEWMTLSFNLSDFEPVFRGRLVEGAPALDPDNIQEIGFLLGDGQSGEFTLEIDWIRAE